MIVVFLTDVMWPKAFTTVRSVSTRGCCMCKVVYMSKQVFRSVLGSMTREGVESAEKRVAPGAHQRVNQSHKAYMVVLCFTAGRCKRKRRTSSHSCSSTSHSTVFW